MTAIRPLDLFAFVAIMAIWGFNFPFAKWGVAELPPIFFVAVRWALVAVLLLPFVRLPRDKLMRLFGIAMTLGVLHFSIMFTGLKDTPASVAALAIQLQVPFASLIAAVVFKDMLGWRRALGLLFAFLGVGLIAGAPEQIGSLQPLAMVITAACIWAVANTQIKLLGEVDVFALNAAVGLFASPFLFLASWVLEDNHAAMIAAAGWKSLIAILYQVFLVVILGYGLWYPLLHRYQMNQAMPFTLLVPIFGVASGIVMLGESLSLQTALGGLLTMAGVAIIVLRRPQIASSSPQPNTRVDDRR
ncbi:MAG: EamA family transporter [Alphaproteobacteria bacterium]|nr:EamA family transporter [Alphaproteobacteria bacterium]